MSYIVPSLDWRTTPPACIGEAPAIFVGATEIEDDAFVLTADALTEALNAANATERVHDILETIAKHSVRTGKLVAELRDLIAGVSLPPMVETELTIAVCVLLVNGPVDVIASPVRPVAGIETFHRARNLNSPESVIDAVRACWQSLFSEETSYRGRGRFSTDMAVIVAPSQLDIPSKLNDAIARVRPARRPPVPGLVAVEDLSAMASLELGRCEPGFRRMFLKRVWLRRTLAEHGLRTYGVIYLVYALDDMPSIAPALRLGLRLSLVRVDWGDGWRVVRDADLLEALADAHGRNLLSDGRHACVQVAEVVPAEQQGFATVRGDGHVLIEAFPGGIHGTKDGRFQPSTYELDATDQTRVDHIVAFDVRGAFDFDAGDWRTISAPPYALELPPEARVELAIATRMLTSALGEVRVEWYLHEGRIYIKDASIESTPFAATMRANVISPGAVEGTVFRVDDLAAYDSLGRAYDLGVVNRDGQRESALEHETLRRDLDALAAIDRPVIVASHASMGLMPLIPYARAFIFERGSLLSHTAIVLRESSVPAVVVPGALSQLSTGDVVRIDDAGNLRVRVQGAGA